MRILKYRKTAKDRLTTDRHSANVERVQMHVTKGDTVRVMRGDDKGKEGVVLEVFPKKNRVLVQGINIVKKHRRAPDRGRAGRDQGDEAPRSPRPT